MSHINEIKAVSQAMMGLFVALALACQKKPALSPAADPMSTLLPPPMGATTYNDELRAELDVLDDILDHRIKNLDELKAYLGHEAIPRPNKSDRNERVIKILMTLPELIPLREELPKPRKSWLKAKLYFLRRRFIEAALLMTEVLKAEPRFIEARNLRARAIFFLGNPDLAVEEFEAIKAMVGEKSEEGLEALYLIGAVVYESNDREEKRLQKGIQAWRRYLALAEPDQPLREEIEISLSELDLRMAGKADAPKAIDPFLPSVEHGDEKNAILRAFAAEELLLAQRLATDALKRGFDPDIATIKARILFKTGRLEESIKLFADITDKAKAYAPGHHYLGMALMMQGKPEEAIIAWQRVIDLHPAYADAHTLRQRMAIAQKMVDGRR